MSEKNSAMQLHFRGGFEGGEKTGVWESEKQAQGWGELHRMKP